TRRLAFARVSRSYVVSATTRRPGESRVPVTTSSDIKKDWIPASAGTTMEVDPYDVNIRPGRIVTFPNLAGSNHATPLRSRCRQCLNDWFGIALGVVLKLATTHPVFVCPRSRASCVREQPAGNVGYRLSQIPKHRH